MIFNILLVSIMKKIYFLKLFTNKMYISWVISRTFVTFSQALLFTFKNLFFFCHRNDFWHNCKIDFLNNYDKTWCSMVKEKRRLFFKRSIKTAIDGHVPAVARAGGGGGGGLVKLSINLYENDQIVPKT